ncbi:MAG: protein kinase [Planctomycetota bacterium]
MSEHDETEDELGEESLLVGRFVDEYLEREAEGNPVELADLLVDHPELEDLVVEQIELVRALDSIVDDGGRPIGRTLGNFQLHGEIGRGGMGVVYEAEELSLGRRVALKVLPFAGMLDPRQLARFQNEARAAAQLHHPHIVAVHSVGTERGVHYYAMQLIEGQSLAQLLREVRGLSDDASWIRAFGLRSSSSDSSTSGSTTLSSLATPASFSYFRAVASLVEQAAGALDHAHDVGVVHRDVKPANLLIDRDGKVWVTDFGLAQFQADSGLTLSGEVLGTLRYMSPEQANGDRGIDARTDIYSLGVTLYQLATLELPFDGRDRGELLGRILREEPRRPRTVRRDVPTDLETIILKAIEKSPADRYASMAELRADLSSFIQDRPIQARRASLRERSWRWCRRNRLVATFGALSVLFCAIALGAFYFLTEIREARDNANAERLRVELERGKTEVYAALSESRSRRSRRGMARLDEMSAELQSAAQILSKLDLPEEEKETLALELRNEIIACDLRLDASVKSHWKIVGVRKHDISPDFTHWTSTDFSGRAFVYPVGGQEPIATLPKRERDAESRFGPNGRYIVVQRYTSSLQRVRYLLWEWSRNRIVFEVPGTHSHSAAAISPDSKTFTTIRLDGVAPTLTAYDIESGKPIGSRPINKSRGHMAAHDGILAVGGDGAIEVVRGEPQHWKTTNFLSPILPGASSSIRLPKSATFVYFLDFSHDGKRLACGANDGKLRVYDTETLSLVSTAAGNQSAIVGVRFHPHGRLIATTGWDHTARIFDTQSGEERLRLQGTAYFGVRFSPRGDQLGLSWQNGDEMFTWSIRDSKLHDTFPARPRGSYFCVSSDGRWIATAQYKGEGIAIYSTATGAELAHFAVKGAHTIWCRPESGDLMVASESLGSLLRLPVVSRADGSVRIGPPRVVLDAGVRHAREDPARQRTVAYGRTGAYLFDASGNGPRRITRRTAIAGADITSDGFVTWVEENTPTYGARVLARRLGSSENLLDLKTARARVVVSDDDRWLSVSTLESVLLYEIESIQNGPRSKITSALAGNPPPVAFSTDSELFAVAVGDGSLHLIDLKTLKTLLVLSPSGNAVSKHLAFGPHDRRLISRRSDDSVRIYDLEAIARKLEQSGTPLRWSPEPLERKIEPLARVTAVTGITGKWARRSRVKSDETCRAELAKALTETPKDPELHRQMAAWQIANDQPEPALHDLKRAIELDPTRVSYRLARADLAEELGQFEVAIEDLQQVLEHDQGEPQRTKRTERIAELQEEASLPGDVVKTLEALEKRKRKLSPESRERLERCRGGGPRG